MSSVKSCVSLPRKQIEFLNKHGYSKSRLLQNQINELMKKSEGQTLREQPSDESTVKGDSNFG